MILLRRLHLRKFLTQFGNEKKMLSTSQTEDVLFDAKNNCGLITLNKPKALNAINLSMVHEILSNLMVWEDTMSMVIIKGNGRAFCAGGDIKSIVAGGTQNTMRGKLFFMNEYTMNYKIGTYKLPYISLLDGITMGGGVGLSVHGKYRVATEKTMFAMPETAIGLFPDVGASHFLSRVPGNIGTYLALTGHRLVGAECLRVGFATHFCKSEDIPELLNSLIETNGSIDGIEETLNKFSSDTNSTMFSLEEHKDLINKAFGQRSVEDIFKALEEDGSSWAKATLDTMGKMSPISLKVSLQEILIGKSLGLRQCLQMEYRLAVAALEATVSKDFYEGVRAMLIDKDKNPKWNPATINEVTDTMLLQCFMPISTEDELMLL